jgi:hypothetical protein
MVLFLGSRAEAIPTEDYAGKGTWKKRKLYGNSKDSGSDFAALERGQTSKW